MTFNRTDIATIANKLLQTFETNDVREIDKARQAVGSKYPQDDSQFIEFEMRPSKCGTTALTISYVSPDQGIPLEIRFNMVYGYGEILLKSTELFEEYKPFGVCPHGNIQQYRFLPVDFSQACEELERLGKLE